MAVLRACLSSVRRSEIECEVCRQAGPCGMRIFMRRDGRADCVVRVCEDCLIDPAGMVVLRACGRGTYWPTRFQTWVPVVDAEAVEQG